MRVTTAFCRLLRLSGVWVRGVSFEKHRVVVTVVLRRRRLLCPECGFSTRYRYDTRPVLSRWRHLDLGAWRLEVEASLRRLSCPTHGERTEGVPFARHRSGFSGDFEDLVAYLATRMDKTAITRLLRIDWETVGRICQRVVTDELDPGRLDDLFEIGVDEVFDELGEARSSQITAVSMDMGPAFAKSVRAEGHAPQAVICYDPFHVVALATKALDEVRRPLWQEIRRIDSDAARRFKGARWALLKNPEDLTDTQTQTLAAIRRNGGAMWRAYQLKEALRAIFAGGLDDEEVADMLDRWCQWAQRCRLGPFTKTGRTIRKHRDGILAAIRLGINNARIEGLNNQVRLIVRRAFGFHSAQAALALVMLSCGPIQLVLPHERA